jgi:hypothetical protein
LLFPPANDSGDKFTNKNKAFTPPLFEVAAENPHPLVINLRSFSTLRRMTVPEWQVSGCIGIA